MMCLPMRRTAAMRLCSNVAAISGAEDFSGSFFRPSHTDSTTSPVTRLARPRAMVSTSGSSGIGNRKSLTTKYTKVHEGNRFVSLVAVNRRALLFQERAFLQFLECLLQLFLRVHDDRTIPRDGLF